MRSVVEVDDIHMAGVAVDVDDRGLEKALRRFRRLVEDDGILFEVKRRQRFEAQRPSIRRRKRTKRKAKS